MRVGTSSNYQIITPFCMPSLADAYVDILGYNILWAASTDCPRYVTVKEDIGCLQLTVLTLS